MMKADVSAAASAAPLVTVITATYNLLQAGRADCMRQCLQSIREQSYPNVEHIIIDGASTDGTLEFLREYERQGVLKLFSEPDKGIYDAFNKGIARANGKYIAFLNSDDFWQDSRGVEASVAALEGEQADFSYAPCMHVGKDTFMMDESISCFLFRTPFCHQTMFTRTECLRRLGGFDLQYKVFADCDAIVKLILQGAKAVRVPLCFTSFREGGFWETYDPVLLEQERRQMFRNRFAPLVEEAEFERLWDYRISSAFRRALRHCVHPAIYREVRSHFRWKRRDQSWHYRAGRKVKRSWLRRLTDWWVYTYDMYVVRRHAR